MSRFAILDTRFLTATAVAQPTVLSVNNQWVAPGETIRVTVTAAPHALFAIVASTVGTGEAFAGVALEVGEGYVVIASGVLDGVGRAVISYSPPFTVRARTRYFGVTPFDRMAGRGPLSWSTIPSDLSH